MAYPSKIVAGFVAFAGIFGAGSALAGGAVCLVADPIWRTGHSTAQSTLSTAIDTMGSTFAQQSLTTQQSLMSALRVHTRQTSLNAEREAVGEAASVQAAANVYVEQRSAELARQAYETYGQQGQMVGGCEMISELQLADEAMRARMDRVGIVLTSGGIDAVPGAAVAPLEAAGRRLSNDTPESVSAVSFFAPDTTAENRDAYMNNVIGMPFYVPEGIGGVDDEITFMAARRWEAMRSPAIVSLAAVRAASEPAGHGHGGEGSMGYLEALDWYLAQFGGGPEYEQWSASLVTLSPVGLRKEIARLRAINLQLASYRTESQDRQLAVLSTLLAGAAVE